MSRLTKKSNSILKAIEYQLIDEKENLVANEGIKKIPVLATNKLGRLEDIEEELEIDLILSVNICKKANNQKYVYMKDSYGISKLTFLNNLDVELFNHRLYANSWGVWVSLDLKEYGKEWSLTREELENDN